MSLYARGLPGFLGLQAPKVLRYDTASATRLKGAPISSCNEAFHQRWPTNVGKECGLESLLSCSDNPPILGEKNGDCREKLRIVRPNIPVDRASVDLVC